MDKCVCETPCGKIAGLLTENGVATYRGIRYATAGRWEYPQVVHHWVSTPFKNVIFRRNRMSFFAGQHTGVYSLNYRPTCRLEARQVLIYQCILDLTGENGKYNYSKAAHLYPPLSYSPCSAKNYKIASALTHTAVIISRKR